MNRVTSTNLRPLNEREEKFLNLVTSPAYCRDSKGLVRAYTDAGYEATGNVMGKARAKLRDLSEHFQLRMFEKVGLHVPWALEELVRLARESTNDQVKLKALGMILDRAGFTGQMAMPAKEDDTKQLTKEELRKEIIHLLERVREKPNLKVVGGKDE